jgi:hypothetical protein
LNGDGRIGFGAAVPATEPTLSSGNPRDNSPATFNSLVVTKSSGTQRARRCKKIQGSKKRAAAKLTFSNQ